MNLNILIMPAIFYASSKLTSQEVRAPVPDLTHHSEGRVTVSVEEVGGGVHAGGRFHLPSRFLHVLPVHVGAGRIVHQGELQQRPEHEGQTHPRPYVDGLRV